MMKVDERANRPYSQWAGERRELELLVEEKSNAALKSDSPNMANNSDNSLVRYFYFLFFIIRVATTQFLVNI